MPDGGAVFQSTPPVKAATMKFALLKSASAFQSTPPVKAATLQQGIGALAGMISIHAAREGGDVIPSKPVVQISNFNPRRP